MIFLFQMSPSGVGGRLGFLRQLQVYQAQSRRSCSNRWLDLLTSVVLVMTWAVLPLNAQDNIALQASELMRAGKFHDAELLWRQLEQQHPKDAVIHGNLGVALAQQGKLEAATTEYRRALAIKPDQPEVEFNLGIAEFKQGHFLGAISAFELVAEAKPGDLRSTIDR